MTEAEAGDATEVASTAYFVCEAIVFYIEVRALSISCLSLAAQMGLLRQM